MRPADIPRFIGRDIAGIDSALAFPYFDLDGRPSPFSRIKIFPPLKKEGGGMIKYLQIKKSKPQLYILPQVLKHLNDPKVPLWIIEGEKKTAKAVEIGIAAVGIAGVWNWVKTGTTDLIDDFDKINLWKREVFIFPDADTWEETEKGKQIKFAVYALGRKLKERGAVVKFKVQHSTMNGNGANNGTGI